MSEDERLVAEYAAVAAARAQRITALVQERDDLAASRATAPSGASVSEQQARIAELEAQVKVLRRRLRQVRAERERVTRHPAVRVARKIVRLTRRGRGADAT